MPDHAGRPGCRDADRKQADDLKQGPKYRFSAGPITTVHDIVAGADGSGRQIDEYHIFTEKHGFSSKAKKGEHRSVQQQTGQADTESNCRAQ